MLRLPRQYHRPRPPQPPQPPLQLLNQQHHLHQHSPQALESSRIARSLRIELHRASFRRITFPLLSSNVSLCDVNSSGSSSTRALTSDRLHIHLRPLLHRPLPPPLHQQEQSHLRSLHPLPMAHMLSLSPSQLAQLPKADQTAHVHPWCSMCQHLQTNHCPVQARSHRACRWSQARMD